MTTLDKLYNVKSAGKGGGSGSPLDDLFREEAEKKVNKIRDLEAGRILLEREKEYERARRELEEIKGRDGMGAWSSGLSGAPGSNPAVELIKYLAKEGMDIKKATELINNLDDVTLMKLAMLSGNPAAANQMSPFLMFAKQSTASPSEMAGVAEKYFNMGKAAQPQPQPAVAMTAKDLADAVVTLRPPKNDSDEALAYFSEKLEKFEAGLQAEREARHQAELKNVTDLAARDKADMDRRLSEINSKLDAKNAEATTKDPFAYVTNAKQKLTELGIVGEAKDSSPIDAADKITSTIMNSPGVTGLLNNVGMRIRDRGGGAAAGGVAGKPVMPGQSFFCDHCLTTGKRVSLPITPGLAAGKETVSCPTCGTVYGRQGSPGQAGGGAPGAPSPGQGGNNF